jgi:hypothetical protein
MLVGAQIRFGRFGEENILDPTGTRTPTPIIKHSKLSKLRVGEGGERESFAWGYNWVVLSLGDINIETWSSRLWVGISSRLRPIPKPFIVIGMRISTFRFIFTSSETIATCCTAGVRFPTVEEIFFLHHSVHTGSDAHPSLLSGGFWGLFLRT